MSQIHGFAMHDKAYCSISALDSVLQKLSAIKVILELELSPIEIKCHKILIILYLHGILKKIMFGCT